MTRYSARVIFNSTVSLLESYICGFFIMTNGIDQKNNRDIMEIMVVNIGQHYFHNGHLRFAQIPIMKIMLTDIHDIFPHNDIYLKKLMNTIRLIN